jgi:hypothetical protein
MKFNTFKTFFRRFRDHVLTGGARLLTQRSSISPEVSCPVSQIWTEFMNWLTFANAGMLSQGNAYCFDYAIRNLPSKSPIVEIGSFCGLSTNMITYMKERHGAKNPLVTCDKWLFEGSEGGGMLGDSRTISHEEYREFVKASYIRNVRMFSRHDLPWTIEALSDEFFRAWSAGEKRIDILGREIILGGPISFCYIDGNHSYEFARRDFENTDKHLEPGGFLLFDDSADESQWEVRKVVREVIRTGRYHLVAKNPNYFFRKETAPITLDS